MTVQDFEEKGYAIIDTSRFAYPIKALSHNLAEWLNDCEFGNMKLPHKFPTLLDLVSYVHAHEKENEITSRIYQVLPSIPMIYEFLTQASLQNTLHSYGLTKPTLGTVPLIRIDRPGDEKYTTPWHQDKWFSLSSDHSVVLWAPLGDMDESMGFLQVIPGSHKAGIVSFKNRTSGREPYEPVIPPSEEQSIQVKMNFGDILIFHQDLLHRSNINQSRNCRVSMQLRFNDMYKQPYPHTTFTANHSEHVLQKQKMFLRE